jgi:hypothetical protein
MFQTGQGNFTVLKLHGDDMTMKWEDGETVTLLAREMEKSAAITRTSSSTNCECNLSPNGENPDAKTKAIGVAALLSRS